jgi:hypothetical protein
MLAPEDRKKQNRHMLIVLGVFFGLLLVTCGVIGVVAAPSSGTSSIPTPTTGQRQQIVLHATATRVATATVTAKATAAPTATKAPKPTATPRPKPKPTPCPGVNCNPWGYNFSPGNLIYSPPSDFCAYFNCIASFWNGKGYVEECQDDSFSLSGGRSGSCSYHGGDKRPLYSH